ncbi:MAG TPA: hypothetical protein VFI31_02835 [Pirellulales bacterium]|nr:hypothetical protein [Pirellulales bacterium]
MMTLGELIELAAIAAARAPALIHSNATFAPEYVAQYWSASKCRQQRWSQAIKKFSSDTNFDEAAATEKDTRRAGPAVDARTLLYEILLSEVLTRVWTATVVLHDRQRKTDDAAPIVRSVYLGHLETRRRALSLLVHGPQVARDDATELNRWRRRSERWTDMLLGHLLGSHLLVHDDVSEFAFDAGLAREFARDFAGQCAWRGDGGALAIMLASLKSGCGSLPPVASANHDLNSQIGSAVLGCLGIDSFDSLGIPRSLWTARLLSAADSTRGLVEQLFAEFSPAAIQANRFITRG